MVFPAPAAKTRRDNGTQPLALPRVAAAAPLGSRPLSLHPVLAPAKDPNRSNGRDHGQKTCHVAHGESAMKKRKRPPAEIELRRPVLRRRLGRRGPGLEAKTGRTPHVIFADRRRGHYPGTITGSVGLGFWCPLPLLHFALAPPPEPPKTPTILAEFAGSRTCAPTNSEILAQAATAAATRDRKKGFGRRVLLLVGNFAPVCRWAEGEVGKIGELMALLIIPGVKAGRAAVVPHRPGHPCAFVHHLRPRRASAACSRSRYRAMLTPCPVTSQCRDFCSVSRRRV